MKTFLSVCLLFFCVAFVSAQDIKEEQFKPELEKRQKELFDLIDQKEKLSQDIAILSTQIANEADATAKKGLEDQKKNKQAEIDNLTNDITKKCDEFAEYHRFLEFYQNVSEEFLNTYKVRICQVYKTPATVAPSQLQEARNQTFKSKLDADQAAINAEVDRKFEEDAKIALLEENIKKEEKKLSTFELETKRDSIKEIIKKYVEERDSIVKENAERVDTIQKKCKEFEAYKTYLNTHETLPDSFMKDYKARNCLLFPEEEKKIDYTKFIVIGKNDPVAKESLFTNEETQKVLSDVFSIESETDLGTFEIPGNETYIKFYSRQKNDKALFEPETQGDDYVSVNTLKEKYPWKESKKNEQNNSGSNANGKSLGIKAPKTDNDNANKANFSLVPDGAMFKSIQIELREGGIVDARLILLSKNRKTQFYFEGTAPVSILHYTRKNAERNFLEYSHHVSTGSEKELYNEKALKLLLVRYIDVLDYHPNVGSNYVPDDISYTFPSNNSDEATITTRRSYEVINDNNLQHVLDIRAYTDFLGLFGDEPNGLFQIEGKADFFVNPFNIPREALYFAKKISPYVRYSRLDEDEDFVQATLDTGTSTYMLSDKKLELLERSNLEMGLNLNVINFRLFKESPFWTSFYLPVSYNVANVQTDASLSKVNFSTLGIGAGVEFELKRFNNFGLNLGYELKAYSYLDDYESDNLVEPGFLKTQSFKAEVFYFPGLDRSQSVFLRMRSMTDISSGGGDSFFQLQFGYRFTLGVGAVKAQ